MKRALIFRALAALSAVAFLLSIAPNPAAATPWTPMVWKDNGKLRHWVRDTNDNFVDDLIEARADSMTVIVDLNNCVGDPASSPFIAYLKTLGDVTYVGKYLSLVVVTGIDRDEARQIGARSEVAMVELAQTGRWTWDVYQAAKVRSSTTYAQTLESGFGWPATLDGNGVNIAILDTGVGPAYDASFRHGYNALTDSIENPMAEPAATDHAGYMAQLIYDPANGIARGSGLIDIKIGDGSGPDPMAYVRALEKIYEMHRTWQIHVVSISAVFSGAADGRESWNQLVDLISGMGVLVVAGSGDNAPDSQVLTPGAATRALAVATADIHNTVDRANDTATTVQGPRANDGDTDLLDELKPEVVFPMGGSTWLPTNSAATAATAGLAALAFGYNSQLTDFDNKAAGNVKDLLIRSAEAKGTADTAVVYPQAAATWDNH
ncbi:MAG TPA: S8 family serine peptidase [Methylococcus sp.]|nr:S8 family serine peptidase [Methylococcus sp.]